jgi:hypothetical protein
MAASKYTRKQLMDSRAYYASHPVQFVEHMMLCLTRDEIAAQRPGRRVEPEQAAILNALAGHKTILRETKTGLSIGEVQEHHPDVMGGARVSVVSGHGIGKTYTIGFAIPWWLATREDAKAVLTGPKFDQLKATTWASLARIHAHSRLIGAFECKTDTYQRKTNPLTWFAKIITAQKQESITGVHDPHLLVIIDEASAEVIDKMRDGIISLTTQADNKVLLVGNGTRTSGFFYETHNTDRQLWYTLHFDSEKSMNVSRKWLDFMKLKYHPDSDMYRVRVKGCFPRGDPRAIISLEECEKARMRIVEPSGAVEIGVDPALEGNDLMTVCIRQGYHVFEIQTKPKTTPTEQIIWVLSVVRAYRIKLNYKDKIRIKVDAGGGYGAGLIEALSLNTTDNIECIPVRNDAASTNPNYYRYGTQMYFDFAAIITQVELPDDCNLVDELASRQWKPHGLGMACIETKHDFKKRTGASSPNRADACVLAFAGGPKKVFDRPQITVQNFRKFEIDWSAGGGRALRDGNFDGPVAAEGMHIVALVLTKNLTMVGLAAIYECYRNRLWIYHEYRQDRPVVDVIAPMIRYYSHLGNFRDKREPKIIGNEIMFCKEGARRPLADILLREGRLYIHEPYQYDEFGATALGIQLFADGRVIMHDDVCEARKDIAQWTTDGTRLSETENPYCKALLLILSEARQCKKIIPVDRLQQDYRPIGNEADGVMGMRQEENQQPKSWMAR